MARKSLIPGGPATVFCADCVHFREGPGSAMDCLDPSVNAGHVPWLVKRIPRTAIEARGTKELCGPSAYYYTAARQE